MVYEKGFAIVGIGCRFPGGVTSLEGLWNVLSGGKDVVTSVRASALIWHGTGILIARPPGAPVP